MAPPFLALVLEQLHCLLICCCGALAAAQARAHVHTAVVELVRHCGVLACVRAPDRVHSAVVVVAALLLGAQSHAALMMVVVVVVVVVAVAVVVVVVAQCALAVSTHVVAVLVRLQGRVWAPEQGCDLSDLCDLGCGLAAHVLLHAVWL